MTKRIDLKTGFLCNNNCRFCVQGHKKRFGNKGTEELKEYLSRAAGEGYKAVVFTGGEPTIRQDIVDLVKYARSCGFQFIQIQSNGRKFAGLDFCKALIAAGANEFAPAIHGPNAAIHDFLTQSKGSFYETAKGIKNLKGLGQKVMTNTVITRANYRHLPQIARLLVRLKVDQFQLAFVHAIGSAGDNFDDVVPRKLLVVPHVKQALDAGIKAGINVMTEAIPYCFMTGYEDYVAEERIPETKILDLDSVVENFTATRRDECKVKDEKCRGCKYFERCEGPWKEYPEHFGWAEFTPVIIQQAKLLKLVRGCHFGSSYDDWKAARSFIARAINRDGTILDIGCANGFLLKCLMHWSRFRLIPYGFDRRARKVRDAKLLFPSFENHFSVLDVRDFEKLEGRGFPGSYDYIYSNIWDSCGFQKKGQRECLLKVFSKVSPGGRLILGLYDFDAKSASVQIERVSECLKRKPDGCLENDIKKDMLFWFNKGQFEQE
ncbi:MAG: radical SAM protein [Candidatus Omnitrophota bacterium]